MSVLKMSVAGAMGFAAGVGMGLLPGTQKWKRQAQKQVDKLAKMAKNW